LVAAIVPKSKEIPGTTISRKMSKTMSYDFLIMELYSTLMFDIKSKSKSKSKSKNKVI